MSQTAKALRATSDALLQDLERLFEIENEKRALAPDDPRLVPMSEEVAELAARLLDKSEMQRALSMRTEELVQRGDPDAPTDPIEATPREIPVILAEWREAERVAAGLDPDSPEAHEVAARIERLRGEYREAHRRATEREGRS
ncbi:MAG TPA: hypothetical protein VFK54_04825 [Candidatus Limnocylindrales bacterium]|nr:hypothetical protein [Candidatus Limnocylindrales bacterium]